MSTRIQGLLITFGGILWALSGMLIMQQLEDGSPLWWRLWMYSLTFWTPGLIFVIIGVNRFVSSKKD